MNTAGIVVLILVLALLISAASWVYYTRRRAARLGLPPPSLTSYIPFLGASRSAASAYGGPAAAPGGLVGWLNDRLRLRRNKRTAAGAYEGGAYSAGYAGGAGNNSRGIAGGGGGGFGRLGSDDDAWDTRVGAHNPYEEERELGGLGPQHGVAVVHGEGYSMNLPVTPRAGGGAAAPALGVRAQAGVGPQGEGEEEEEERRGRTRSRSPGRQNPFADDAEPSNISLRGVSPRPMEASSFAGRKAAKGEEDRRSVFREEV